MRTPASVRLFNLQPCESLHLQYYLLQIVGKLCFRQNSAQMQYSTSKQRLCCAVFLWRKCKVRKFCERSKILQKVKKFATSNCGVRRIRGVFLIFCHFCRYKTACILTCLGFVFCGENAGSEILRKVKNFAKSSKIYNKQLRREAYFKCFCMFLPLQNGVHFDVSLRCALKTHPTFTAKLLEKQKALCMKQSA